MIKDDFNENDNRGKMTKIILNTLLGIAFLVGLIVAIVQCVKAEDASVGLPLIIISFFIAVFGITINEAIFLFFDDVKYIRNKLYEDELNETNSEQIQTATGKINTTNNYESATKNTNKDNVVYTDDENIKKLIKLKDLYNSGILTEEEYKKYKEKIFVSETKDNAATTSF
ncbi:MAG: hypothetical protein HP008_06145 [Clostridia bacterium]|nr:hypothetical protein [Clostridia bacterium]